MDRLLKTRPSWAQALALRGGFLLEEAESLPPGNRAPKAQEALQAFKTAFTMNRNLVKAWQVQADHAQRLCGGAS